MITVLCCNKSLRNKIESYLDTYRRSKNISMEEWPLIRKSRKYNFDLHKLSFSS